MNVALIFAGGTGQRMNTKSRPKQFLEVNGKPILVYTLEIFQNLPEIDKIVLVCLEPWIPFAQRLVRRYELSKVEAIVPGGSCGQESIFHGVRKAKELYPEDALLLIHDGVRPLVLEETILKCIACAEEHGSAVTVVPAIETVAMVDDGGMVTDIPEKKRCVLARAPQCFPLGKVYEAHTKAIADGRSDFVDTAELMSHYGTALYTVQGSTDNIKVTTPVDFYIFRAILDAKQGSELFGAQ